MKPKKINCSKVYTLGHKYHMYKTEIESNKKRLMDIKNNINEAWSGKDGDTFARKFEDHINSLNEIISLLQSEGNILIDNALTHSNNDDDFATIMRRRD